jgi:hypothetical protein
VAKGTAYRLPKAYRAIQVVAGHAWITYGEKDIILAQGESMVLNTSRGNAVITSIGEPRLVFEVSKG